MTRASLLPAAPARPTTGRVFARRYTAPALAAGALLALSACTHTPATPPARLPAGLRGVGLTTDDTLTAAAAALCTTDGPPRIDRAVRQRLGLSTGQLEALAHEERESNRAFAARARARATALGARHAGYAACGPTTTRRGVLLLGRVLLTLKNPDALASTLPAGQSVSLALRVPTNTTDVTAFIERPDGHIERHGVPLQAGRGQLLFLPTGGPGSYTVELLVSPQPNDPQVALLWPVDVARPSTPVRTRSTARADGDVGRGFLAESLLNRLRTTVELEDLFVSRALTEVAAARADALSSADALGHAVAHESPMQALARMHPRYAVRTLHEVQARGGTLAEAWDALQNSPAHRAALLSAKTSHMGIAVRTRATDAGPVTTLVMVLARRLRAQPAHVLRPELYARINLARHQKKRGPIRAHRGMTALAAALADAHMRSPDAFGALATEISDAAGVSIVHAALDDPLRLLPTGALTSRENVVAGLGLARDADSPWHVVCVLATRAPSPEALEQAHALVRAAR